jgi:hypothetical protein
MVPAEDADEATRELARCMEMELFASRSSPIPAGPRSARADST